MNSSVDPGDAEPVTVLVVDDDPDVLTTIDLYLREFGYDVILAKSGAEALRHIRVKAPDVMLLDLMMPGMSGTELMVRLREMGLHVPIIIISADVEAPRRVRAHQQEGILIKPFNFADMRAMIDRLVARRQPATSSRGEPQSGSRSPDEAGRTERG